MPDGSKVLSYGNSILRRASLRWSHQVGTVTPRIPGDSGSAFIDRQGRAFGTLSTLALAPLPASNGVGDLSRELAYARSFADFANVGLLNGTEPFRGPLLP